MNNTTKTIHTGSNTVLELTAHGGDIEVITREADAYGVATYLPVADLRTALATLFPEKARTYVNSEGETDWEGLYLAENRHAQNVARERDKYRAKLTDANAAIATLHEEAENSARHRDYLHSSREIWIACAKERQGIIEEQEALIEALRAEQPRPLTADDITDEARDRAYRAVATLSVSDWDDMSGVAKGRAMALVETVIAEITRPEPPARPEGAGDIEATLFEWNEMDDNGDYSLNPDIIAELADHLARSFPVGSES